MDRAALDRFFANADDVLDDWHGSPDAMTFWAGSDEEPGAADSYYEQWERPIGASYGLYQMRSLPTEPPTPEQIAAAVRGIQQMASAFTEMTRAVGEAARHFGELLTKSHLLPEAVPPTPRARALWLRQNRNTGPPPRVGLDGHYRRA